MSTKSPSAPSVSPSPSTKATKPATKPQDRSGGRKFTQGAPKDPKAVHGIVAALLPLSVPIGQIRPDPANERTHGDTNLASIRASLKKFGQREPLVVNARTGMIEAGHGRHTAMVDLGWTHVAVVLVDDDPRTAAGFRLAGNRTAELADWNDTKLLETIRSLGDGLAGDIGFSQQDIARLEKSLVQIPDDMPPDPSVKPTFGKEITCPSCNHKWRTKS